MRIASLYFKRFFFLFTVFKYDLVIIEKELFPYCPALVERLFRLLNVRYVVEYDDAIFHNYDNNKRWIIRLFLKNKIDVVMKFSSGTIVGNTYLRDRALKAGAGNVVVIPTVIDLKRYKCKSNFNNSKLVIGWIGSPSTLKYLHLLTNVFKKLDADFELHIVGGGSGIGLPEIEKIIKWDERTEVDSILQFDIGIMPLLDDKWERGKCAYKLIQYMACGIPVIGSPVGANVDVIRDGKCGFFAQSDEEWVQSFEILINDCRLRREFGFNGRAIVADNYTVKAVTETYINFISDVILRSK